MVESKKNVISVDIGTSSVRACLVNADLHILHQSQTALGLETDHTGKAIQNAKEIIQKAVGCIREIQQLASEMHATIEAISFSNAVSSLVPLNRNFEPNGPVFTYADTRSHRQAEILREDKETGRFQFTACPMHASYWLPKLLWLKQEAPELFKSDYFCTIKDLLIYRLSGQFVTDFSNAVATGLCDVRKKNWDEKLLKIAGVSHQQLPAIQPTTFVLEMHGKETGLTPIPIVLGATDGVLSSLGAGAVRPGQVTTMIGSSGACRIACNRPLVDKAYNVIWSYPLDETLWIRGGAMNNGGLAMRWAAEIFHEHRAGDEESALDMLLAEALPIDPGAEGLVFLPYLFGERAPIWNEHARGVYFGIGSYHKKGHFSRATLEGILYALYSIYEIISNDQQGEIEIRASGGYVRSDLMLQIQADMFGQPVHVPNNLEGSSIGAAALAFKAVGVIKKLTDVTDRIGVKKAFYPDGENHRIYIDLFARFTRLYEILKPLMEAEGSHA